MKRRPLSVRAGRVTEGQFSGIIAEREAVYRLAEVILLVLCGELAGADGFAEIAEWGERQLDFLRRFLLFRQGTFHDDFCRLRTGHGPQKLRGYPPHRHQSADPSQGQTGHAPNSKKGRMVNRLP